MYDSRLIWREPVPMPSVLSIGGFGELGEVTNPSLDAS